jgi:hypothetical protein
MRDRCRKKSATEACIRNRAHVSLAPFALTGTATTTSQGPGIDISTIIIRPPLFARPEPLRTQIM